MSNPFEIQPEPMLTLEEFERLPEEDAYKLELVRGRVVREPFPAPLHARVLSRLVHLLYQETEERGLGVLLTDGGFVLEEEPPTVRGPDLAFVSNDRVPLTGYGRGFWHIGPDLAIEVLSPSNRSSQIQDKVLQYLAAGVRLVWVIDPVTRSATIYRQNGTAKVLTSSEALDGGDVLPSLRLSLAELFAL